MPEITPSRNAIVGMSRKLFMRVLYHARCVASSRNRDFFHGDAGLVHGEHPSEVGDEAIHLLMREVLDHGLACPRVEDGVGHEGIPKEGIEEGRFC